MLKKVQSVQFHTAPFIKGLGDVGKTLPNQAKTYKGFKMAAGLADGVEGLHIEANGAKFTVPYVNCIFIHYAVGESLIPEDKLAAPALHELVINKTQ